MGAAWCRHRAERARDPKSPLDRVIVRCVDKFYSVDPGATPVRIPKPTPGGVASPLGVDDMDIVPLHSVHRETGAATRLAAGASPWQKASLQVPRSEEPRQAAPAAGPADTAGDAASSSTASEDSPSAGPQRAPVPPPRRKRQARRKVGVTRPPPPPRPPSISEPPREEDQKKQRKEDQPIMHLLSPPKPRPKNTSTVSLPEWRELERPEPPAQPPRPASTSPRPQYLRPPSLTSVSESTLERVETYLRRCRSFGSMPSGELVDKLSSIDADSDGDDDPWDGIDDFEHAFQPAKGSPPHTPRSRVDGRNRRSGVSASTPVNPPKKSTAKTTREVTTPSPPPSPLPDNGETRGRFFISSPEDDWFNRDYQRETPAASTNGPEKDLSEVKKELQSIIYDYNRTKKISTSSMEVLPTQPIRTTPKKKKISVASLTPPPSPVASDLEDESAPSVPASAVINGEANADANTHSTLLRLLRECQNIEGALDQMEVEDNDMPQVHSALRNMCENNRHLKETSKQTLRSLDSGLDVRGSLERAQEPPVSADAMETKKNIDSGVDESDDLLATHRPIKTSLDAATPPVASTGADADSAVVRRKREARDDDGGSSSGRSSMTPSLSELEAALSDMLEKSAAAGDDDRASPIPPERMEAAKTAVAAVAASAAAVVGPRDDAAATAPALPSEPAADPAPALMCIPKISVTHDNAPSVH